MGRPVKLALFAAVFLFTAAFSINLCATLYQCGCQFFWAGADAHCNIHNHAGRHCPWCARGGIGFVISMAPVFITQAIVIFRSGPWSVLTRLAIALSAFPVVGVSVGLVVGWVQGYWSR